MKRDLSGQVIIITGASSGIGRATAVHCARAGMDVVLNARRADRLQDLAQEIHGLGRRAVIVAGSVTEPGMTDRMLDAAMERFGRFDAVFANAGYGFRKAILDVTEAQTREIWEVNFFAGLDLLRKAARRLIEQQRAGSLLMCSSCLAKFTLPYFGSYCSTKAAQNLACRSMRLELEPYGISVSSVHPISTRTEFSAVSTRRSGESAGGPGSEAEGPRGPFVQSADQVARAVVKCLRQPTPEVWTSFTTRLGAAIMTAWPGFADIVFRRARNRMKPPEGQSTGA